MFPSLTWGSPSNSMRDRSRDASQTYLGFPFKLNERQIKRCFPDLPGVPLQTQRQIQRCFPVLPGLPPQTQLETDPRVFISFTWGSPSNSMRDRSRGASQTYLGFPFKLNERQIQGCFPFKLRDRSKGVSQSYLGFPIKLSETHPEMFPSLTWGSPSNSITDRSRGAFQSYLGFPFKLSERQIQGCFPVQPDLLVATGVGRYVLVHL